jgi:hypothetical protein
MKILIFIIGYITCVAIIGIVMIIVYVNKYKGIPINVWKPEVAWTRAIIYFSFCNIIIAISGTLGELINQPFVTIIQIANPYWIFYCTFCFIYIFFAYWILWSRMTLTFNRKYYIGSEIIFGVIWGFSTGGLLLSFYHLWSLIIFIGWLKYLLSFATMGLW